MDQKSEGGYSCTVVPPGILVLLGIPFCKDDVLLKHTFSGSPTEALLTRTQTMTMCSAFEHLMNENGAI